MPKKTNTQTKSKVIPDINLDPQSQNLPSSYKDPLDDIKKNAGLNDPQIKKASAQRTQQATRNINPTDDMSNMLGKMRNIAIDPDLEPYDSGLDEPETLPSTEVNTSNLPAVASSNLQAAGVINPEFHQVSSLPGNISAAIRQLGKHLFGAFTTTPTKDIYVVANLGGQGPNTSQEVNAVAGYLKKNGKDLGIGDIDFDNIMPGYKADIYQYSAGGIRWMLVKDFAGQYIYCWPEKDSKNHTTPSELPSSRRQLR